MAAAAFLYHRWPKKWQRKKASTWQQLAEAEKISASLKKTLKIIPLQQLLPKADQPLFTRLQQELNRIRTFQTRKCVKPLHGHFLPPNFQHHTSTLKWK